MFRDGREHLVIVPSELILSGKPGFHDTLIEGQGFIGDDQIFIKNL